MNGLRIAVGLTITCLVAACGGMPEGPPHSCPGATGKLVPVNIHYNAPDIKVHPDPAQAAQGDILQFNVTASNGSLIKTEGKTDKDAWLLGGIIKTKGTTKFYVCVPNDLFDSSNRGKEPRTAEFKYTVEADADILDPRVTVSEF